MQLGIFSVKKASKEWEVCRSNLQNRLKGVHTGILGSPKKFTDAEEDSMIAGDIMTDSGRIKFLEERLAAKAKEAGGKTVSKNSMVSVPRKASQAKKPKSSRDFLWSFSVMVQVLVLFLLIYYLPIFTLAPVWFIPVHVRLSHSPFCAAWKRGLIQEKLMAYLFATGTAE